MQPGELWIVHGALQQDAQAPNGGRKNCDGRSGKLICGFQAAQNYFCRLISLGSTAGLFSNFGMAEIRYRRY